MVAQRTTQNVLDQLSDSIKALSERIAPAIVEIRIAGYGEVDGDEAEAGELTKQRALGSGVILDSNGYIVTNAHVVSGAKRIRVILNPVPKDGMSARATVDGGESIFNATLVGTDADTDLAVLKIEASGLPTVPLANYDDLRQGQIVLAFGSPLGYRDAVTMGVVSSVARQLENEDSNVYIQTDAVLNPGNSGGALVDTHGRVVGINTLITDSEKIGFAIPSDTVKFVYEQIRRSGRVQAGDVGLEVQQVTPRIAAGLGLERGSGVIVSDVRPGGPADKAGVKPLDIILKIDGSISENSLEFLAHLHQIRPGNRVRLQILRQSSVMVFEIPVSEKIPAPEARAKTFDPERGLILRLGIFGVDADHNTVASTHPMRQVSGVLVTGKIVPGEGTDVQSRLKVGDIIHTVNRTRIADIKQLREVLEKLRPGDSVVLGLERNSKLLFVPFEVD